MGILIQQLPYLGVTLVLLLGAFGFPLPEDLALLWGGYACGTGHADIYIMLPVCFLAILSGDTIVYVLGRRFGGHVARLPVLRRYLTTARIEKVSENLKAHLGKTIFFARFLPGFRTTIYFTTGALKMPYRKLLLFDGIAAVISIPIWVSLSFYFANRFQELVEFSHHTHIIIVTIFIAAIGSLCCWVWLRSKNDNNNNSKEGQNIISSKTSRQNT